jgi:hypothetical protein
MDSVERQNNHDDEVGNQHRGVEGVPPVEAVKVIDLVGVVRLPIVANALGSEQQREESRRCMEERRQVVAPAKVSGIGSILRDTMQDRAVGS